MRVDLHHPTLVVSLVLLCALMASCGAPVAAPAPTVAPTPQPPPTPTLTPPSTPTPAQMPEQGSLEKGTVTSPALAGNLLGDPDTRRYFIYLPPSYHVSDKRYPVVVFLHDDPDLAELEQTGVRQALDAQIKAGGIGELIAVFPNAVPGTGLSWYRNSPVTGDYETYITQDLVDAIDATYRTIANPASRVIASVGGIGKLATAGAGANGALHLALSHPDVFGATAAVNGIFDVEAWVDAKLRSYRLAPQDEDNAWLVDSIAAIVSPNADNPPDYLNPLFEQIDGEWEIPTAVREKIRLLNPMSDLETYASQPIKLRGILMVQQAKWASEAQALDASMTALGIEHEYEEDAGPFIARTFQQRLLDFLAEALVFGQE